MQCCWPSPTAVERFRVVRSLGELSARLRMTSSRDHRRFNKCHCGDIANRRDCGEPKARSMWRVVLSWLPAFRAGRGRLPRVRGGTGYVRVRGRLLLRVRGGTYFAAFGQPLLGFFRAHPGGMTIGFIRLAHLLDFHQESFDHELLHAAGLPEDTFGMDDRDENAAARWCPLRPASSAASAPLAAWLCESLRVGAIPSGRSTYCRHWY